MQKPPKVCGKGVFAGRPNQCATGCRICVNFIEEDPPLLRAPCPKISGNVKKFVGCVISSESVAKIKFLGRGNFGEVWLAKYRGLDVAVKTSLASTSRKEIVEEADVMHSLYHLRLVRFIGVCCEPLTAPLMLLTEYMKNGSLEGYLRQNKGQIPYEILLRMLYEV